MQVTENIPTTFGAGTDPAVARILSGAIGTGRRLRLFLGDADTGLDWNEEWDTTGRVGRSCGSVRVPILLRNVRSISGGAILSGCIVRIMENGRDLWRHPTYRCRAFRIIDNPIPGAPPYAVQREGTLDGKDWKDHAAFRTAAAAARWVDYINGRRAAK